MGGEQVDPVVPPSVTAGELRDRQELQGANAQRDEVVEPDDGGVEGALGGERPDVTLVDDPVAERRRAERMVTPGISRVIDHPRGAVYPVRLGLRTRVRQGVPTVDGVPVLLASPGRSIDRMPAAPARVHGIPLVLKDEVHRSREGSPDPEAHPAIVSQLHQAALTVTVAACWAGGATPSSRPGRTMP